jgi:hypothetical protein
MMQVGLCCQQAALRCCTSIGLLYHEDIMQLLHHLLSKLSTIAASRQFFDDLLSQHGSFAPFLAIYVVAMIEHAMVLLHEDAAGLDYDCGKFV